MQIDGEYHDSLLEGCMKKTAACLTLFEYDAVRKQLVGSTVLLRDVVC